MTFYKKTKIALATIVILLLSGQAYHSVTRQEGSEQLLGTELRRLYLMDSGGTVINPSTYDAQTDGSQTTSIVDPNDPTRKGEFDSAFEVPISIGVEHHEMHEGDHYFFKSYVVDTGGSGSETIFAFTTPTTTTRIHAKALLSPDVDFTVELHEGATITGGTPVEGFNNERDSANIAELDAVASPTINTPGTLIWSARNGGGKSPVGVSPGFNYEIVAKADAIYTFTLTKNVVQEGIVDIDFFWYEHTPE